MSLQSHMALGGSTVCRYWRIKRGDGLALGFSDHDEDFTLQGQLYRKQSGLTAGALQLSSGLSVDNSEALGALHSDMISDRDLAAGLYDGAEIQVGLVNWADLEQSALLFAGYLGEVTRHAGSFRVELRGLADLLNQPRGQIYGRDCAAVLGDQRCRFALEQTGYHVKTTVIDLSADGRILTFEPLSDFQPRWFEAGHVLLANGLKSGVKSDRILPKGRQIELWQALAIRPALGEEVTLYAGCDKRAVTCRAKFANFVNFRGFPHLPSRDWLSQTPK